VTVQLQPGERACPRHPHVGFSALRPCAECFSDPGPMPEDTFALDDPEALAHEAWLLAGRDALFALASLQEKRREDNESQDRIGAAVVIKALEGALKFERTLLEEREKRIRRETAAKKFQAFKELQGKGRAH
jgi:hypothetical protein